MKKVCFALCLPLLFIACKKDKVTESGVIICSQVWMAKNLDVSTYRNGDPIPEITDYNEWITATSGAWCWFNNDTASAGIGKLYNWYAVTDPRGLAPRGWHVASKEDWLVLSSYIAEHIQTDESFVSQLAVYGLLNFSNLARDINLDFTSQPGYLDEWNQMYSWTSAPDSLITYISPDPGYKAQYFSVAKQTGVTVRCVKDSK